MLLPHGQSVPEELAERRNALMSQLPDALIIVTSRWDLKDDTEPNCQQDQSFYYLTELSNAIGAVLLLDGPMREATLFVADEHPGVQFFHAPGLLGDSTAHRLGLTRVVGVDEFQGFVDTLIAQRSNVTVLVAEERPLVTGIPGVGEVANRGATLRSALQARWPRLQVDTLGPELRHLRAIKSPREIERMRRAGSAAVEALLAGITAVAPGKT